MEIILHIVKHTLKDGLKLLPFLFITYLIMEYIEHKMKDKSKEAIKKSGKLGPIIGSILGIFPQCGFSVSATNLYAGRVITLGTLIAVYLSTSDEMLPIFISEAVSPLVIFKILVIKLVIGMISGFIVDFLIILINRSKNENNKKTEELISDFCDEEHCHCKENGIFRSALKHTLNIIAYILFILFIINLVVHMIGEENIKNIFLNKPIIAPMISAAIGLIPNCAASVIITNMYLENLISVSSLIAGLLTSSGVGLAVLFKINKDLKKNIGIVFLLYFIGVLSGIILESIGIII